MGVAVLAALLVGILATTSTPRTNAKRLSELQNNTVRPGYGLGPLAKAFTPVLDAVTSVVELDGDITDSPAGSPDDWNTINCDGGNAVVKTGIVFDGLGKSIYTGGGSKDPELLSSWRHKDCSVPAKGELLNAYAAKFVGAGGDDILAFGADRYGNDGTAFMGFWFFKNLVIPAADGRFRKGPLATDPLSAHNIGDVLVLIEFTNGGAVATSNG